MKKLLLLLFLIPIMSYGQDETTINLNQTIGNAQVDGMKYLGSGNYSFTQIGWSEIWSSSKNLEKKGRDNINGYARSLDANFKIINVEKLKQGGRPKIVISFKLTTKDGQPFISKNEAKKQILELKELLELEIISKEEFDNKVEFLKKILLGN